MKNTKITSILISASMAILVFTGCGSTTKAPNATNPPINNTTKPNQPISTTTMKTLYSKTLKELVTAKTITKTQSKKVLATITQDMSQGSGTTNNSAGTTPSTGTNMTPNTGAYGGTGAGTSSGGIGTGTGTTNSTNQTGTTNNATTMINRLSSLVKSRVITQVQADTIHKKIQTELGNIQGNK